MCDAEFDYSNEVDGFMEDLEFEDTSIQCPAPRKTAKTEKYFIILSVEDIVAKMVAIVLDVQEIIPVRYFFMGRILLCMQKILIQIIRVATVHNGSHPVGQLQVESQSIGPSVLWERRRLRCVFRQRQSAEPIRIWANMQHRFNGLGRLPGLLCGPKRMHTI